MLYNILMVNGLNRKKAFAILRIFGVLFLIPVVFKLFQIQIVQHDEYVAAAKSVRVKQYELLAKRGQVYFSNGKTGVTPAILNERTWTVFVDPSYVIDKDKVELEIGKILKDKMIVEWKDVWSDMTRQYIEIAKNVDYETVAAVKEANLRGVGRKETSRRVYPNGQLGSQLLGFINAEGNGSGIEGALNERLTGTDGLLKTVTDVNAIPLSIGDDNIEIPAKDGDNIVLTIDENIQRKVEKVLQDAMKKNSGIAAASALVMDPNTGRVYAMANYPTYDPSEYWKVTDASLFTNRVTESLYEPASICKPFTYAAAIDKGVLRPTDTYTNYGTTKVEDRIINNAYGTANYTGVLTFQVALNHSLNTGSVEALRRLGGGSINYTARKELYDYLSNGFHLGQKTGVELYEEAGILYSPDDEQGNAVRYANMTFGQGMSATMLQVAAGFSALINGGDYYQPTVIAGVLDENGNLIADEQKKPKTESVVSDSTSQTMRDMLVGVRSGDGGQYDPKGYRIGVKTGTAETLNEQGLYTSEKTNASALGFGGSGGQGDLPEYVILVRLDGNTLLWGGLNAVPLFTEISNYMISYLRIAPSN